MGLETGTYIDSLNASNPVGASDPKSQGDDHIRLLKSTILASFPSITGAMTATHTELNILDGATLSTAELNILDGVTATAAELNILDGVTATAAELNLMDGVTLTTANINNAALKAAANIFTANQTIQEADPTIWFIDDGAAANNGRWALRITGEQLRFQAWNDAISGSGTFMAVDRTSNVIDTIAFAATDMTQAGNLAVTGDLSMIGTAHSFQTLSTGNALEIGFFGLTITPNMATGKLLSGAHASGASLYTYFDSSDMELVAGTTSTYKYGLVLSPRGSTHGAGEGFHIYARGTLAATIGATGDVVTPNTSAAEIGTKGMEQNIQNASYTLLLTDASKAIYKASGGAGETITIPANASVAFPIGTVIEVINQGGGTLSLAITTDTLTLLGAGSTGTRTISDDGSAVIRKVTATAWVVSGAGVS